MLPIRQAKCSRQPTSRVNPRAQPQGGPCRPRRSRRRCVGGRRSRSGRWRRSTVAKLYFCYHARTVRAVRGRRMMCRAIPASDISLGHGIGDEGAEELVATVAPPPRTSGRAPPAPLRRPLSPWLRPTPIRDSRTGHELAACRRVSVLSLTLSCLSAQCQYLLSSFY